MYITRHSNITTSTVVDQLWALYELAYRPLAAEDVTREMLFRTEFDAVLGDGSNRITVLHDDDDRPIAMAAIATDIGSTRYLSRADFEKHYPERMAKSLIHYVMWIVVHPDHQGSSIRMSLARDGFAPEQAEGAMLVFDLPESNHPNCSGGLPELFFRLAKMVGPVDLKSFGASRYYALDFAPAKATMTHTVGDGEPAQV